MSVTLKILNGDLISIVLEQGEMFDISKMIRISSGGDGRDDWNDCNFEISNSFYFLSEKMGRALTSSDILVDGDILSMFIVPKVFTDIIQENMACFLKDGNNSRKIKMYEASFSYAVDENYLIFFWDRRDCFFMDKVVTHKFKNKKYFVYPLSGFVTFRTFDEMIDTLDINLACADQLKADWRAGAIDIVESLNFDI